MADASVSLRAKRKRGRPRKDSNLSGSLHSPENSTPPNPQFIETNPKDTNADTMVGSIVYGVIEGSFDAGYLISVRIGNNHTPFRGVVFQPRKFVPVSASNDIAPQAKMYHRTEVPVPVYDNVNQTTSAGFSPHSGAGLQPVPASKQAIMRPVLSSPPLCPYSSSNQSSFMAPEATLMRTSSCSNLEGKIAAPKSPNSGVCKQFSYVHPTGSLRMVEEDEVMQAFEVSTSSGGSKNNVGGDMQSESLSKAATSNFPDKESIRQEDQIQGKPLESAVGANVENMPCSSFIQQDEMIGRGIEQHGEFVQNRLQNPTTAAAPQEISAQTENLAKTEHLQQSNQFYNVNFHQNLFSGQSQAEQGDFYDGVSKSPNLKLDLAFSVHENKSLTHGGDLPPNYSVLSGMRNPNLGFHQALVAGNPLLLPPDLSSEPLEFMMEKPKSPPNCKTALERGGMFHGEAAVSPSASYKLELATPQSGLNTRAEMQTNSGGGCIGDMDFVLSDAIRPAESNLHQSGPSEAQQR